MKMGETTIEGFEAANKTFADIQKAMEDAPEVFNALVIGDFGSGKTTLAATARRPILIHSFDPGGSRSIKDQCEEGGIYVDTRFEYESRKKPTAYMLWMKEMARFEKEKTFENLGTYVIDSATTWYMAMYNQANILGGEKGYKFWQSIIDQVTDGVARCHAAPCDFIMTGHVDYDKDEVLGSVQAKVMIGGSMARKLPILFDEYYVMRVKPGTENKHVILTRRDGLHKPSTRLGSGGRFTKEEEPNIKALLKKAGYSTEDKPYPKREEK